MNTTPLPIILASSSIFRQQQLRQLNLHFQSVHPHCDETPLINETPAQTAQRLAQGKAQSLATQFPHHLIIGADQVAFCNNQQLGKPMNIERARTMLNQLQGQIIHFYSALYLLNSHSQRQHLHIDETIVKMRPLTSKQINNYLQCEPDAIYCAGAAKSEGLGAVLIEHIHSSDPNALIGLPIFRLIDFLHIEGVDILSIQTTSY